MAAAVHVVGGVDPHADTIHVAVLTGRVVLQLCTPEGLRSEVVTRGADRATFRAARHSSICMPSSTTRPGGRPKNSVALCELRERNENSATRQRHIPERPVAISVSRPR